MKLVSVCFCRQVQPVSLPTHPDYGKYCYWFIQLVDNFISIQHGPVDGLPTSTLNAEKHLPSPPFIKMVHVFVHAAGIRVSLVAYQSSHSPGVVISRSE